MIARLVEHKIRVGMFSGIVEITPVGEEYRAEAGTPDGFEKAGWGDLVGVDVGTIERNDKPGMCCKWFQFIKLLSVKARTG